MNDRCTSSQKSERFLLLKKLGELHSRPVVIQKKSNIYWADNLTSPIYYRNIDMIVGQNGICAVMNEAVIALFEDAKTISHNIYIIPPTM